MGNIANFLKASDNSHDHFFCYFDINPILPFIDFVLKGAITDWHNKKISIRFRILSRVEDRHDMSKITPHKIFSDF